MKQSAIAAMIERDLLRRDTEKGRVETRVIARCAKPDRSIAAAIIARRVVLSMPLTGSRHLIRPMPAKPLTCRCGVGPLLPGRPMSLSVRLTTPTC